MVFKALMGGGSRDDLSSRGSVRRKSSTTGGDGSGRTSSSRRPSKISSASSVSSSRRPTRGDDRDRGLGDFSASRSVTGDSTTTYVTAEPASYVDEPLIIERPPRSDRDDRQRSSRDSGDRDSRRKPEKRYSEERSSRDGTNGRDRTRPRAQSGDTAAHFAAEIANPGFNQFPMQYDSSNIPGTSAPYHSPLDSHITQQFPGQLPDTTAQPYIPPNPAGFAADYYNDQGQSVAHQPGVRPQAPDIIIGAEPHLQPASPMANPPPEPSSLGQVGAAAEYYAGGDSVATSSTPAATSRPPKPSKPSKPSSSRPSKPVSGSSIAGESATFGIGSELMNQASANYSTTSGGPSRPPMQATGGSSSSHNGVGLALGGAAAGAAAAYMINHHSDQSNSNAHNTNHHNDSYGIGIPTNGNFQSSSYQGNASPYAPSGYTNRPPLGPSYPSGGMQPGSLAYHQKHHGPLSAFVDFWRDPEGVGKFEDYTEAIGVCKYCFEPGTSSLNAPRKHHHDRRRRSPVVDRYGSSSRVDKLTRYNSSEDESRRKKSKGSSWLAGGLAGGLAGYVAKSLFSNKDFEDTYSVRSGTRVDSSRRHTYDDESMASSSKASSTSRGVISKKRSSDDKISASKDSKYYRYSRRSSRSRSRSTSRDRRTSSGLKEAAIGAAVGTALTAAARRPSERDRSQDRSTRHRRRQSESSGSINFERSRRRGRSSPRGFKSFFTTPSANRRKKSSRKDRGFFSFGNSSSSSGDFDLAFGGSELFGSTVSGRSSRSSKSSRKQNVDAEILGLGLAARQLAHSSSRKELTPRDLARPPGYGRPTKVEDEEWEDAESSDSTVSTNLAYGGSAIFGSSDSVTSGSSFWPWSSSSRKQKKAQRQYSQPAPTNDYPYYSNDYASQDGSSGRGSLQQVIPVPTSDPTRFDVVRMSTSSSPNVQPPLVRPGPIPLQQPQPFTPVSQSVYYPTVTAPIDPLVQCIGLVDSSSRDISRQRRSNSSPVLPMAPLDGPSPGILKRRATAKDAGTVSFNLTEEQTDRQQEVDRRDKERASRRRTEDFAVLREEADELAELGRRLDRERRGEERRRREEAEAEEAARKARREQRRKEAKIDDIPSVLSNGERTNIVENRTRKADERKEPSSSSRVTPAIVGAGAAIIAGSRAEKAFEDDRSSASTSRHEERREKRRSERRGASESQSEVTEVPRHIRPVLEDDDEHKEKEQRIAKIAASRIIQNQSPTAHESYEDFFAPDDIRHHDNHEDSSPNIIEVVPRSERRMEPYLGSDLDKPDPSWPPLVINIIKPTPPGSYDGSVRDAHSPVPTIPEPVEKEEPKEEPKEEEVESGPVRPTTGSRVSWGEHQFHEYEVETPLSDREEHFDESEHHEVAVSPEHHEHERRYETFVEEKPVPREVDETQTDSKQSMPGSFDDDVEFAATLAAGAEIAGFDPTVVTDDATYYGKDHLSKFKDTYRPPAVESVTDLGEAVSVQSGPARKDFPASESFDLEDAHTDGIKASKDGQTGTRSIAVTEPEDVTMSEILDRRSTTELRDDTGDSVPSSPVRDESKKSKKKKRRSRTLDDVDIDSEERSSRRSASSDHSDSKRQENSDDVDFEPTLKRVESAPVTDDWIEEDKERRRRKSKRGSSDRTESLDGARSVAASAPGADELEEYRSRRSSRRSKDDGADLEGDSRSLPDMDDDGERRRRRKHKRHSGTFDDAASVVSSPAKIDETREKRRSRESSTASTHRSREPEKKSGSLFSSLFGSKTNLERSSSTTGKRETQSEIGVDDSTSERRRKKKSSSRRSLSGDGLDGWDVASEAAQSTMDLSQLGRALDDGDGDNDSQSSRRKRREQKRRDKYEEIVDSARDASEKDRYTTAGDKDDDKNSFLGMRPEMPPVNSHEEDSTRNLVGGASGLAIATGALGLGSTSIEDQLQDVNQRLRSRSVSPSMAEKTFELAPRSQSRPSSPGGSHQEEKELRARRLSLLRTSDSPTAVPLHFRKPPTSPNSSRRVSMTSPAQSPSSPRSGHRRPNSLEFKNVREIRPLWLVERHSTSKLDVEPEGPLPSLPSSKTSSRSPSIENLREGFDDGEDAVTGFFMGSGDSAYSWGRKPVDLRISTDQLPAEEDDYLNSQQATPTAETYNNDNKQFGPPPIKKEKPKYEFHSPSELLQDPTTYQSMVPELPETMDRLPSVAGSELGGKAEDALAVEPAREVDVREEVQSEGQKSGLSSFLAGAGFASVVDAAVSAAVNDHKPASSDVDKHEADSKELNDSADDKAQTPTSSKPESFGGFGSIVDAAVTEHASHDVIDTEHDQSMKADEDIAREHARSPNTSLFAGVVDAAVAAAAGEAATKVEQQDVARDIDLQEAAVPEQRAEGLPPVEAEETKAVTDAEASSGTSKKQKRKDKKKKKKSKDLDAPAEDNDEEGMMTPAAPVVELDSSAQPEPVAVAEAEAERAAEPLDETSMVAEQQPVSEESGVKDSALEDTNDQVLAGDSQDHSREIEAPNSIVETELSPEAVTASAENEQTTSGTNDQSPHVAAEPEDEGIASVAATGSKSSKKKKKNKKKSLSLSETASTETPEAVTADKPQIDPSVSITEEPKAIGEAVEEKPLFEETSASIPPEALETTAEIMATSDEKQQDKLEPVASESVERSGAEEGDIGMVDQDVKVSPDTEQNKSLNSPVDEWFDSAETAEEPPSESVKITQNSTDKEIETPTVPEDTTGTLEPPEMKQTEEEPITTSSSKKKNKKKKKKGQSLSVDESALQETALDTPEPVQSQAENVDAPSLESEAAQDGNSEGQCRDVEEVMPEPSEFLPAEAEQHAAKPDDASITAVPDIEPVTEVAEVAAEAVTESESTPEKTDEAVESVSSENLQSEIDTISPEQSTKEIEEAEATPAQEAFEEVPSTPSKSKKKKGKKGKRVSWAEGAELTVESEPPTPAEPETPAFEEEALTVTSEVPEPTIEEQAMVPASADLEPSNVSENELPREVSELSIPAETAESAAFSSHDADSALASEPSSNAEAPTIEPYTDAQSEQPTEGVETLEEQPVTLPESSKSDQATEIPEEEADQSEGATSKSKKKKEKKKDKKKKKAAEASILADEESTQPSEPPVHDVVKDVVTAPEISESVEATPAEQPAPEEHTADVLPAGPPESQIPEISEPIETISVEQPAVDETLTEIIPTEAPESAAPETLEPTEPMPVDQPTADEQTSTIIPEDALVPAASEVTADEPKSTDIAEEEEEPQKTSKSKKKKDKKKKKAAAAVAAAAAIISEQYSFEPPVAQEAEEPAETVVSDSAEIKEDAVVEDFKPDDAKDVTLEEPVAEPQILEEPIEKSVEEPVQESVQDPLSGPAQDAVQDYAQELSEMPVEEVAQEPTPVPVEETNPRDLADDVPFQETSKSKKKKDKKKKKAAEALLLDENPVPSDKTTDSIPGTPAETLEGTEPTPQAQQISEEEKSEDVIIAENKEPQPVENPTETPSEEVKTLEVAEDDEWPQETSKSKKKKDKKKKKAATALALEEEPASSERVVEEAEAKPTETESSEPQEQPVLDEAANEIREEQTAEPQLAEPPAEDKKAVEDAKDNSWALETSSKSKKKKDKKKKKAAEAILLDDEPQSPVKEEVAEPAETALSEVQDLPAVEEHDPKNVSKDQDVQPEIADSQAVAASEETKDLPVPEEPKPDLASTDKDVVPETAVISAENPAEDANAVVTAEEEWAQEPSSKSKKKKEKKKKKAAETLPWDEEPTPSDKPTDEQAPANTEQSTPPAQEDSPDDNKKPDDATEVLDTDAPPAETPAEETKQVDTLEDDSWAQETSKSKKKKDKKKRKSLQLEAAQEESTPDVVTEETKEISETVPAAEPTSASEDVAPLVEEEKESDTQLPQEDSAAVHTESVEPAQADNIEDEGSLSKSSKSKKKKNKKNKSKDEPMPWDEEPSVKTPDVQPEAVADQPVATEDVPNEESARELETPATVESTEQEKQDSEQIAEVGPEGEELPVNTQVEGVEPTELPQIEESKFPTHGSVPVQPEESADQDSMNAVELAEPQPPTDLETTGAVEQSPTDVPTSAVLDEPTNDNESSQAKSAKKSKKKKKRDSMPWDDESTEQQESSTVPITVEGDETVLKDLQGEEKQAEPAPTEELQSQQDPSTAESKNLDSVEADVEPEKEYAEASTTEPTRQLSAKEKRKEKKKQKRRTLDLADDSIPAVADDVPESTALAEPPMSDEQPKGDEVTTEDFAPVGKKKGKKTKRQSVSWEEEVIEAVAEEETKPDEPQDSEKNATPSEDLDSGPSQTENELQETPVEVEGKETFQSSEETHTDQKEKDFDWTDNVVSPQVQSQTEESPFPVRSPISDDRDDPDQSRPSTTTVDDENVIPEAVADDQLPAAVQQEERSAEPSTADVQPVDQEAEEIDWTASKSSKKSKKKKKQKSITTVPEEPVIDEESTSRTPVEQDDKPDIEQQAVDSEQPRETQEEPAVVEDSALDSESVPLDIIDTEQLREIQEEPAPVAQAPLVPDPAPAVEIDAEEEFKPAGSSKKKGKKNKKKANAWSFEELSEERVEEQNTDEIPIQPPGDEVKEEIAAVDNDKTEVPEEAPLAPDSAQEKVLEGLTTEDTTVIPDGLVEEKSYIQEEAPEGEAAPISEPPSRKLSKKEKRKMKKGKKIDFEEDEPIVETVPNEQAEVISSEQVSEAAEKKVVSEPGVDNTHVIDEKPAEIEPAVEEVPVTNEQQVADIEPVDTELATDEPPILAEEQQVAAEKPVDIGPIPKELPMITEEKPTGILDTKLSEPVFEEPPTAMKDQQIADVKPAESVAEEAPFAIEEQVADLMPVHSEPVSEKAPTSSEEQVVERDLEIAPAQEEPIVRKLSKKEKRKNKKRITEHWPDEEPFEANKDITPQPDAVEPAAAQEPERHILRDVAAEESTGAEPEHAQVSLDPFEVPDAEDEGLNEPPADFVIDADVTPRDSEPKLDADAVVRARQLEQEADLAVAASLFGDSVEPESNQIVSRQSSKKQKGKKGKKDKKNAQLEEQTLKDTTPASQIKKIPSEEIVKEEKHDTKPSGSVEEISRSWPSVEFDNDLSRTYSRDKDVPQRNEFEAENQTQSPKLPAKDSGAEETGEDSTRSILDKQVVDVGKASQQGHRSQSPSQKEDVDMIISATMAAAGFFPSTVTAPAEKNAFTEIQSTSGTSRNVTDIYEHRDGFSDVHSKSSMTTFDAPEGESKSNKLADIFPGLERVKYRKPSPKSHEKQATDTLVAEERSLPMQTPVRSLKKTQSTHHLSGRELPVTVESTSKDRSSSLLFDSSPSTRLEPTPDTTQRASSSPTRLLQHQTSSGSLHRTQSIHGHHSEHASGSLHRTKSIHGHHSGAPRNLQLEDELTPTKRASSQSPQPLLRPDHHEGLSPPRTPLDPIKEHDGARLPSPSPRLVMGDGPYKLERPDSRSSVRSSRSLRKANRSISGDLRAVAAASQAKEQQQSNPDWTSVDAAQNGRKKGKAGRQEVGHPSQPLNQADDSFHDDQLHDNNHDGHDDFDRRHLENIPSSSSYDPVTDKGKRPVRGMSDVYEGWGETPNSPRSPTRPPSVRRRQSMQHLQELETRLDQLISENRLLAAAKDEAEQKLSRVGIARRKSDQALNTSNADLRDKEAEIARLTKSLEWMQSEVQRLTSENEAVHAKHAELTASHAREVDGLRTRQLELASGMEGIVREQISAALAEKDAELRRLRDELAAARQAVQELQQQIVAATADDVLSIHDEDYFDNSCQRLCQHVQQWVLRFSKHSDLRRCRPLSEVRNTNVADRFDNAILDGTDIDAILADRVRRRDVFVAVVMAMIWEYVFTRYLFGMDRDQRQKLKALEKQLSEIGPRRAVAHWRALTLTLLAKRPSFADQRVRDTEAVALEIMDTLSQLLPPPQSAQSQLLESLRGVLRRAANLSIEMRTQRAEYVMLPPLQPEYDSQGDLARQVSFNASLMNERSGLYNSNETLESQGTPVRLVLFPLVVKKGNDLGDGDEEIVVCPAQVLVAWPDNEKPRDRMSALGNRSVSSVVPSVDMGNMI